MPQHSSSEHEPKELNVITLEEAMTKTNNWREAIKSQFDNRPGKVPHGFYISLTDLTEIVNDFKDHKVNGQPRPCVGARIYFTLPDAVAPGGSIPADAISGILVPCYEEAIRTSSQTNNDSLFRDIIVPVKSAVKGAYSIYNVTQPCPPMCDPNSPLV
ncbi:hypothetical protein LZZ85_17835 [Terrimonas sp. NA20]|uniref:Uncharacterized protein n=1 Tax=Terrimonas ginsenosidimutans TaxID=2908004 RepID=A0ABS9KV24_9BACT|nr:hypothetical protein [Terrimonas ginsenosidimutans]MCG2616163.1 hypothetical protein [Terrimonas ginsenosidimutans]